MLFSTSVASAGQVSPGVHHQKRCHDDVLKAEDDNTTANTTAWIHNSEKAPKVKDNMSVIKINVILIYFSSLPFRNFSRSNSISKG